MVAVTPAFTRKTRLVEELRSNVLNRQQIRARSLDRQILVNRDLTILKQNRPRHIVRNVMVLPAQASITACRNAPARCRHRWSPPGIRCANQIDVLNKPLFPAITGFSDPKNTKPKLKQRITKYHRYFYFHRLLS